uniref:Taste receptor type 2 n=1 Tax=Gouania willdenowi TaxID=441366 RepID=A0A8C5I2W4_GOUWI
MMVSSFSTAHYLVKHIRNLAKSTSRLTSPKIQSQIRVTIAGVLQGLLYLFYYIFYLTDILSFIFQPRFCFSSGVLITVTTFVLLGYLVFLTIMHGVTMITWHSTYSRKMSASNIAWVLLVLYTNCCMTCHVWLNFCYYSSIVPAKGVLMVWTKKNLKSVIYVLLIGDTMLYLVNGVLNVTTFGTLFSKTNNQSVAGLNDRMTYTFDVFTVIIQLYLFLCMLIMIVSIFSTAHYLGKHIRNIAKSASRLTSPKMKCQIRIAVAGLVEGLFYLLYYIYYVTNTFIVKFHPEAISASHIIRTIMAYLHILFACNANRQTCVLYNIVENLSLQRATLWKCHFFALYLLTVLHI